MPALIGNLSLGETLVIAGLAVLIFGRRLPEVAGQVVQLLAKLRRSVDDLKRETGIDRDLGMIRDTMRDATREAVIRDPLVPPRAPRTVVEEPPEEPEPKDEPRAPEG
jgi:Sec-independent protein translocase protein TatA